MCSFINELFIGNDFDIMLPQSSQQSTVLFAEKCWMRLHRGMEVRVNAKVDRHVAAAKPYSSALRKVWRLWNFFQT